MSRDYQNQDNITKFEFLLSLEGHIVCQRFFNVRDHVDQSRRSMDLHYYIKNICEDFMEDLKIKSSNYLCENQNYILHSEVVDESAIPEKEHFLQFLTSCFIVFLLFRFCQCGVRNLRISKAHQS